MTQESLEDFLTKLRFSRRYMLFIGRQCRESSISAVAQEQGLDWKTVKDLEKQYMQEQLDSREPVAPTVIGIDEISIKKGHSYRIIVSDLETSTPIWFGGKDRSEKSMDQFYEYLGPERCKNLKLIVMDMWKAFRNSASKNAPQASILFDRFHIIKHLNESLDTVRKQEYKEHKDKEAGVYIKGQKYTLLSRRKNLDQDGSKSLEQLLEANHKLNIAYLLKESFDQLWTYDQVDDARRFFDKWKQSFKDQGLKSFEKFAEMIERHWDGIVAHCTLGLGIKMGFVEGLNNKIRVFQRRAYGIRDEEYLKLKILTFKLKPL